MSQLHYEFTGETKEHTTPIDDIVTLNRIRATQDLPEHYVTKGDLGGWIQSTENLQDRAWVGHEAYVYDIARVFESARIDGQAQVYGSAYVHGQARVYDNARVHGTSLIHDQASVSGHAIVGGNARVESKARVYGFAKVYGSARIYGRAIVRGSTRIHSYARVGGSVDLHWQTELLGHALVESDFDYLSVGLQTSTDAHHGIMQEATLFRDTSRNHRIVLGSWDGSLDSFKEAIAHDFWIGERDTDERESINQELMAVTQLFELRTQRWGK